MTLMLITIISNSLLSNPVEYSKNQTLNNIEPIKDFIDRLIKAFNNKNTEEINECINGEFGLFVLHNPGAYIVVEHFNSFDEIMNLEGEYNIGYLKILKVDCDFKEGKIPHYYCDEEEEEGWDKEGCYYDKVKKMSISKFYKSMIQSGLIDANSAENDIKLAKQSEKYITHLAYCTYGTIGFYLGVIDNNWYLICIDIVTPCDA